jgi:hypothetical protein
MPLVRLIGNAGLSFLTKLSSGYWNLFDPTNGFTAINARVATEVPWHKVNHRYFFESDLLFRLYTIRAVVVDVPLAAKYDAHGTGSSLSVTRSLLQFPYLHLRNLGKRIFYAYFLRDFNAASVNLLVGIMLCVYGILFGSAKWISGYERNVLASPGTVMLAALPVILGWQALLSFVTSDIGNVPTKPLDQLLPVQRNDSYRGARR